MTCGSNSLPLFEACRSSSLVFAAALSVRGSRFSAMSRVDDWAALLARFAPAPRALIEPGGLAGRTDLKFVLPLSSAAELSSSLTDHYAVLRAGDVVVATYRTLYFDTARLDFYHAHRRGRRLRHKVRIRHYPDRQVSFLEVKTRINEMQASKARRKRPYGDSELGPDDIAFIQERTGDHEQLLPQIWTEFHRVTLLGFHTAERVTIDFDLRMEMGSRAESLPNVAIVEVKQWPFSRTTPILSALRSAGFRAGWSSKYCAGIAFTHSDVRRNRLLPGLRTLRAMAA